MTSQELEQEQRIQMLARARAAARRTIDEAQMQIIAQHAVMAGLASEYPAEWGELEERLRRSESGEPSGVVGAMDSDQNGSTGP